MLRWLRRLWCRHEWDGLCGHCVRCGACDELFGTHVECRRRG